MLNSTKNLLTIVFVICLFQINYAQTNKPGISFKRNDDKSVTFTYMKNSPGSVYIILKFTQLTNSSDDIVKATISGYRNTLTTLRPIDPKQGIGFAYGYTTLVGNVKADPDLEFKYILPFKNGKNVKVKNLSYLGKMFGNSEPKNFKAFQFLTEPNDTVFAIRKGIVVSVKDGYKADDEYEFSYKSEANSITVEHEDGTLANYDVLKDNSFMVGIGDTVYPSTPLALAGTYDKEENSQLRLSIFYLDKNVKKLDYDQLKKENLTNQTHFYIYLDPLFYSNQNDKLKLEAGKTYTAICNDNIIELEMSNKEKKLWKKNGQLIKKR